MSDERHTCPKWHELMEVLDDDAALKLVLERAQACEPQDDAWQGVLAYIQDHGMDISGLRNFLRSDPTEHARVKRFPWMRLAAVGLFLIGVGGLVFLLTRDNTSAPDQPNMTEALYESYHRVYPGLPVLLSNETTGKLFNEAMGYYRSKEYNQAATYFYELCQAGSCSDTSRFYGGLSLLENGDLNAAKEWLALVPQGSAYNAAAQYYLGLALLLKEDKASCKKLMESLCSAQHPEFGESACALLEVLE